jgi:hypothetical protein
VGCSRGTGSLTCATLSVVLLFGPAHGNSAGNSITAAVLNGLEKFCRGSGRFYPCARNTVRFLVD